MKWMTHTHTTHTTKEQICKNIYLSLTPFPTFFITIYLKILFFKWQTHTILLFYYDYNQSFPYFHPSFPIHISMSVCVCVWMMSIFMKKKIGRNPFLYTNLMVWSSIPPSIPLGKSPWWLWLDRGVYVWWYDEDDDDDDEDSGRCDLDNWFCLPKSNFLIMHNGWNGMGYEIWFEDGIRKWFQVSLDISTPLPFPPSIVESDEDDSSS